MRKKGVPGLNPVEDIRTVLNKAGRTYTAMNKHLSMETKTGRESSESPKEMAKERAISNVKMLIAKKRK